MGTFEVSADRGGISNEHSGVSKLFEQDEHSRSLLREAGVQTHKFAIEIGGTSHTGLRKMDRSQAVRGLPAPRR